MKHYYDPAAAESAGGILAGFGLSPDSPFIRQSEAYKSSRALPENSEIHKRVSEFRREEARAAWRQRAADALELSLRDVW